MAANPVAGAAFLRPSKSTKQSHSISSSRSSKTSASNDDRPSPRHVSQTDSFSVSEEDRKICRRSRRLLWLPLLLQLRCDRSIVDNEIEILSQSRFTVDNAGDSAGQVEASGK